MKLAVLIIGGLLLALAARVAWGFLEPRELRSRQLDRRSMAELQGLGSVALPPTFRAAGIVNSGPRRRFGSATTTLENHLDEERLSFRFEQGQHGLINGQPANPVTLVVSFFNEKLPADKLAMLQDTPIAEFYAPGDTQRFAGLRWQPVLRSGTLALHTAAVNDAFDARKPRWLVVGIDPVRRLRVDVYAWQSVYALAEAQELVQSVAASLRGTAAVQSHFESIPGFEQRVRAQQSGKLAEAAEQLRVCGIAGLAAGRVAWGEDCIAHLSDSGRFLAVGRYLGRVPLALAAARQGTGQGRRPSFPLAFGEKDFAGSGTVDARPNLDLRLFYWSDTANAWKVDGLQAGLSEHFAAGSDQATPALLAALQARGASARSEAHLWDFTFHDVEFRPQQLDLPAFLARAARYREALAGGRLIAGANATPPPFGKP